MPIVIAPSTIRGIMSRTVPVKKSSPEITNNQEWNALNRTTWILASSRAQPGMASGIRRSGMIPVIRMPTR